MNALKKLAASALLGMATAALAQPAPGAAARAPTPEQMSKIAPAMAQLSTALIEAQLAAAARPENAERLATFKWNLYEALLKKGFTQQQAIDIVAATPVPGAAPVGR